MIINVLLRIVATFSYEALFFALKVQHNLAQGNASLKLRITNDELRMAGFCFSPCKGNTQQPNVKCWTNPVKNGHASKVMPVVFIGVALQSRCYLKMRVAHFTGEARLAPTRDILLFHDTICFHHTIVGSQA